MRWRGKRGEEGEGEGEGEGSEVGGLKRENLGEKGRYQVRIMNL